MSCVSDEETKPASQLDSVSPGWTWKSQTAGANVMLTVPLLLGFLPAGVILNKCLPTLCRRRMGIDRYMSDRYITENYSILLEALSKETAS